MKRSRRKLPFLENSTACQKSMPSFTSLEVPLVEMDGLFIETIRRCQDLALFLDGVVSVVMSGRALCGWVGVCHQRRV